MEVCLASRRWPHFATPRHCPWSTNAATDAGPRSIRCVDDARAPRQPVSHTWPPTCLAVSVVVWPRLGRYAAHVARRSPVSRSRAEVAFCVHSGTGDPSAVRPHGQIVPCGSPSAIRTAPPLGRRPPGRDGHRGHAVPAHVARRSPAAPGLYRMPSRNVGTGATSQRPWVVAVPTESRNNGASHAENRTTASHPEH